MPYVLSTGHGVATGESVFRVSLSSLQVLYSGILKYLKIRNFVVIHIINNQHKMSCINFHFEYRIEIVLTAAKKYKINMSHLPT